MQTLRAFFAILALVAVASLPGPSHALAAAAHERAPVERHVDHIHHGHYDVVGPISPHDAIAAIGRDHGTAPGSPKPCSPCRSCSLACCAPATAAISAPLLLVATIARSLRRQRPEPDRPRSGFISRPALRPPASVSA